jgi:uncharacterized membrane protein
MTRKQKTYFAERVAYPITGIALAIIVLAFGAEATVMIIELMEVL